MTVHCLSKVGIPRSHTEFKDLFGFVYRGAAFALVSLHVCLCGSGRTDGTQRAQVRTTHISTQTAEAAVQAHVKMYMPTSDPSVPEKTCRGDDGV